jgi:superfamily II DNA or RNA helicase
MYVLPFISSQDDLVTAPFKQLSSVEDDGIVVPRLLQQRELAKFREKPFVVVNWPTGSGKTKYLQIQALLNISRQHKHKVVVAVPQHLIAQSFRQAEIFEIDGVRYEWQGDLTDNLKRFLLEEPVASLGCIVTTHQALIRAYTELGDRFNITNGTLVVDECHHLNLGDDEFNRLSEVLDHVLKHRTDQTKILLASATFSRGDSLPIISDEYRGLFEISTVSFSEYWSTLRHLREYSYNYIFYDTDELPQVLLRLLQRQDSKTLIYIPPENSNRLGVYQKKQIIELCETCAVEAGLDPEQIIDLTVASKTRRMTAIKELTSSDIRLVLACGMFKEGADWPAANTIIDFAPSFSNTERRQKFGRATRDFPKKSRFDYFVVLPQSDKNDQECCNEYYGHLIFSLVDQSFYSASTLNIEPVEKVEELFERSLATVMALDGVVDDGYLLNLIEDLVEEIIEPPNQEEKEEKARAVIKALTSIPRMLPTDLMKTLGLTEEIVSKTTLGLFREFATKSNGGLETFKRFEQMTADERYIAKVYADTTGI